MTDQVDAQEAKVLVAISGTPTFSDAFRTARNLGAHEFWWRRERYHTLLNGETEQVNQRPSKFNAETARAQHHDLQYIHN